MKKAQAASPAGEYVAELLKSPRIAPQIVYHRLIAGAPAEYGENVLPWSTAIASLLSRKNIRLYSHQALASDYIRSGRSAVIATPTASGKSLIYNLPVLETFLKDPESRSLYLFPLKALAQDQLQSFRKLVADWPEAARPSAELYDGDTPEAARKQIRNDPPAALLSNPEMLHLSILPYHEKWATFLANLNYIVVDEAHTYRGIFGSHMARVFRRLNRICAHYGASPTYVFCTATLGNPQELAGTLMDGNPALIDKSGAARGARHFLFINPEVAASTCAIDLLRMALEKNLRTIVYCKTRRMTELISLWAGAESGEYKNRISAYRAGFLPEERREIEARMASGDLLAVVSTSALELGIDIGGLDLCVLVGYPGTIMQTLQRGGRVGRGGQESAVVVVAGEDALDQYFMRNPEDFFSRPPEKAVMNPDNATIVARHIECAAMELPLKLDEPELMSPGGQAAKEILLANRRLAANADLSRLIATRVYPQRDVDLRGGGLSYHIENEEGRIIGSIDNYRAWREAHPGAVYIHRGRNYLIESIDDGRQRVVAKAARTDWYTRVRSHKTTDILEEYERFSFGRCPVFRGRLRITDFITGYEKRSVGGNRLLSITPLEAPPRIFETEGIWIVIPEAIRKSLEEKFLHFMGSIHALEHGVIGMLPLEVLSDRNDFGGISIPMHPQLGYAAVFLYDNLPGGAGLTKAAFGEFRRVLESTLKLIGECACEDGCPSCVQSPKCGAGNRPLSKQGVIELLRELLAEGPEGDDIIKALKISPCEEKKGASALSIQTESPVSREPAKPPARYVVFDVETRRSASEVGGWHKASEMGVSVAVLYDSGGDKFFAYTQDELPKMFAKMREADLVVGFNSVRFDYKVLEPFAAREENFDLRSLPTLDLLQKLYERLNYRVSLDNLGKATLDSRKSADGLQALKWWKEGEIDKIAKYCEDDVRLTRDLYRYGLEKGYLLYGNRIQDKIRVDVDFRIKTG